MKASGSLIFEWLDLALAALVTGALSISSLLLMFGVRHNYVIIYNICALFCAQVVVLIPEYVKLAV